MARQRSARTGGSGDRGSAPGRHRDSPLSRQAGVPTEAGEVPISSRAGVPAEAGEVPLSRQAGVPAEAGEVPLASPPAAAAPFKALGFTLSTLGFAVAQGFREKLAPLGVEPRDFALLRAVGAGEGLSQQAIGERLRIPPSRMVAFIDSLEERGLLERRPHPTDRRARALYLTAAGRALLAEAYAAAVEFETDLCRDLGPGEREQLLSLLGKVIGTLGLPPGVHAANMVPDGDGS